MLGFEYAKALYDIHPDKNKCMDEFTCFMNFYDELSPVMKSPVISDNDKKNIIKKSFNSFSDEFIYFIYVAIDNDRFSYLIDSYKEFKKLYNDENNIAECACYTNKSLTKKEKDDVIKFLEKEFNKKIVLNEIVDDSYIGIKIEYENKTIDYTVESRINNMRLSI